MQLSSAKASKSRCSASRLMRCYKNANCVITNIRFVMWRCPPADKSSAINAAPPRCLTPELSEGGPMTLRLQLRRNPALR